MDPKKLRAAQERVDAATTDAATKWATFQAAQTMFENAEVPEGSSLGDMAEFKAAKDAKAAYEAANATVTEATTVRDEIAAMSDEPAAPKPFANITPITGASGPEETAGFKNIGEFVQAVALNPGMLAQRGIEFKNTGMDMGTNTEGGYAVPTAFLPRLFELAGSKAIVRPRATVIPNVGDSPDAELDMVALNQTGSGNMYGGVAVTWQDEENASGSPRTDSALAQIALKPRGVTAYMSLTNKIVRNAGWMQAIFPRLLANAVVGSEDVKFLTGSGNSTTTPRGVANSSGMIYVKRNTSGTIVYEDVLGLFQALHPDCVDNAVFVASQSARTLLMGIKDASGNRVYWVGDPSKGIADSLLGVPVLYTGKVSTKGKKGDLLLVDFAYYLVKDGQSLTISTSEHVQFLTNAVVIKVNQSVDGQGWLTGPMVLEDNSTTVSPYVGLDLAT